MNLIPAEEWIKSKPYSLGSAEPKAIRQIQANALRWAAEKAADLPHYRDSLAFSIAVSQFTESLSLQANQLDPQPPLPPGTISLEEARKRQVCRICELPSEQGPGLPFIYNYGKEYAHQKCLLL